MTTRLPLAGLTVVDCASFIAAPVAATVMADYGADVIKVEPPGSGDPNRQTVGLASYPKSDVNYPWEMDSRGKRSIALDLKCSDGVAVLKRLAARADVFITNYPLDVRDRLGIGYDALRAVAPKLIYASFTGYGETGPDATQPGFDINAFFARSGLLDACRYEGQPPAVVMPAQGDRASGISLLAGILLALMTRTQTGEGQLVTSSLYANGLWCNGVGAQAALLGAVLPLRPPRERPRNALTNVYRSRDDRWMQITVVREDKGWPAFAAVIGRPDLVDDPRFAETAARRANAAELVAIADPVFAREDWPTWRERLVAHGIPVGLIGRLGDLPDDIQAVAAGAVVETANPAMPRGLAAPFAIAAAPVPPLPRAPALGEHTRSILAEAGYSQADIDRLLASGIASA